MRGEHVVPLNWKMISKVSMRHTTLSVFEDFWHGNSVPVGWNPGRQAEQRRGERRVVRRNSGQVSLSRQFGLNLFHSPKRVPSAVYAI